MNQSYEDPRGLLEFSGCLRQIILLIVIVVLVVVFVIGMLANELLRFLL